MEYQESVLGYDDERAKAAMRSFGHGGRTAGEAPAFIDAYDGKGLRLGTVPAPP